MYDDVTNNNNNNIIIIQTFVRHTELNLRRRQSLGGEDV